MLVVAVVVLSVVFVDVVVVEVDVVEVAVVGRVEEVEEDDGLGVVFSISFEQYDLACASLSPISFIVSEPKQFSKN